MIRLIPMGGLGEIGLNMMAVESDDTMFVIDVGLMFPEDYMLGVDYVIPDMTFLKQKSKKVAGIVLTHAHEDHIGALPYLVKDIQAPIFGIDLHWPGDFNRAVGVSVTKLRGDHNISCPESFYRRAWHSSGNPENVS